MKKLLALVLVVISLFSLTSCRLISVAIGIINIIPIDFNGAGVYKYEDFSDDEKEILEEYIGEVIPFIPNDSYSLSGYYGSADYYHGVSITVSGNTPEEFEAYLEKFADYTLTKTYDDTLGTTYRYVKEDVVVTLSYYQVLFRYYLNIYVYSSLSTDIEGGDHIPSENSVISNDGKGLPEGVDGIYTVDFTKAENVKNVADQGRYEDGCPSVGSPAVLVIPVEFSDATAQSKGYTTSAIKDAFCKDGKNDYYSVYDYYYKSSYGKLTLDVTVLDTWFMPERSSKFYYRATEDSGQGSVSVGDMMVIDEALDYLDDIMDLTKFDSDGNGKIDSVVVINTLDIKQRDFNWAYRYWNSFADEDGDLYEYDGVSAYDYVWASYQFLYETVEDGEVEYDSSRKNTYTFIHEFAHVIGADDYYDTQYIDDPMGGYDVMDAMVGDHNPYTKFNLGWITSSRLVVADREISLTLEDFSKTGDTIIVADDWDEALGAYQEYYVLTHYSKEGLNSGEGGYFEQSGLVVYHVNASLYSYTVHGEVYYDVYNNNVSPSTMYGTANNLIEYVTKQDAEYVYIAGDELVGITDDSGDEIGFKISIVSVSDSSTVITITPN